MSADETPLTRRLRRIARIAFVLGVLVLPLTFLPGERVYEDSNDCHASQHECEPAYDRLVLERPAGGVTLAVCIVAMLGSVYGVYRRPTRGAAALSTLCAFGAAVGFVCTMFHFGDLFYARTVMLWPEHAMVPLIGTMFVMLGVFQPMIAVATREPRPTIPTATRLS